MKISKRFQILSSLIFLMTANALFGQYYWFEENEAYDNGFSIVWTTLIGGQIKFSDLGIIDLPELDEDSNSLYAFNDGYIYASQHGGELTSQFKFNMNGASYDADGYVNSFNLSGYASRSNGAGKSKSPESSYGWEIRYDRNFFTAYNDAYSIGLRAGVGFNDYDATYADSINGNLYIQTATVEVEPGVITWVPDTVYVGMANNGPVININQDISFAPLEQIFQETIEDGLISVPSEIDGTYETDSFLGMAHLGVTFQVPFLEHFNAKFSTGFHMTEAFMRFTTDQTMNNSILQENITVIDIESRSESLLGYYGEVNLHYSVRDSSLFLGLRHSGNDEPKPLMTESGMKSTIEIGNTTQLQAGFMHRF